MDGSSAVYQGQNTVEELDQDANLVERIRKGDIQAIAAFAKRYREMVVAITDDIFDDRERSSRAAKATFQQAVLQIRSGVKMGQIEPWLMWIARNEALSLTQYRKTAQATEPRMETFETEPAMLPFRAKAWQDGNDPNSGTPFQDWKQPAYADEREEQQAPQRSVGETGSYRSTRPFEEIPPEEAADSGNRFNADLSREARPKDPASAQNVPEPQQRSEERRTHSLGMTIALSGVILLLVWAAIGLCISKGWLRFPDLGYEWFNTHLFPLF